MAATSSTADDAIALIDLLWRPSTRVGRSGATISSIVDEAITIADEHGLEALTMRELAAHVGVGAMTLYGYVPGKAELIELMVDRATGLTYAGHSTPSAAGDWQEAAWAIARRVFEHGTEHGWLPSVVPARPVLGPGVCRTYELELAAFEGIGLNDLEMDQAVEVVRGMATHAARWQLGLDHVRRSTGMTDRQWWSRVGPRLAEAMSGEELPLSRRVGESVGSAGEPWAAVELGLEMFLAGLRARL